MTKAELLQIGIQLVILIGVVIMVTSMAKDILDIKYQLDDHNVKIRKINERITDHSKWLCDISDHLSDLVTRWKSKSQVNNNQKQ
jgi:cell division protein FtsL